MPELNETAANQVNNAVVKQVESGEFAACLRFLDDAKPLFKQDKFRSLKEYAYDHWAKQRMAAKDWSAGADVYVKAIAVLGTSNLLKTKWWRLSTWPRSVLRLGRCRSRSAPWLPVR